MKLTEYVLEEITFKLIIEALKEQSVKIDEQLGRLAIQIVEEKDEEIKIDLIAEYNKLRKLDIFDVKNLTIDDLDYKTKKSLKDKINKMVGTIYTQEFAKQIVDGVKKSEM